MATESPIRMCHVVPSRSGSAPPTVEGSTTSFHALMDPKNSTLSIANSEFLDCESEEQMRTDPAYIAYYYANVNLNPRLPPPLLSRENLHLVRLMGSFGIKKLTSGNDSLLATHREEPEEDPSREQGLGDQLGKNVSEQKRAPLDVDNRDLADFMQGVFPRVPSPASGTAVKGNNDHDIHTVPDQVLEMQESCSGSVDVHDNVYTINRVAIKCADLEDNMSTQSNVGSDISVLESRMKSLNVSGGLVAEDSQIRHDNIHLRDTNRLPGHPSQNTMYQFPGLQGHVVHQGMHGSHPKLPGFQPLMHNSGSVPPLYAATAAYMSSGNLYYPSLHPPGFPNPQFVGGFSANSVFNHPYFGGYLHSNAFPVPIDAYSARGVFKQAIEVTGGNGMNPYTSQMMLRPSFSDPLQGQILHQPFDNVWKSVVVQHGIQGQFVAPASQKGSDTASSIGDKELSHPVSGNLHILTPTNGTHVSVNYYGHPPSLGMPQFPTPSPVLLPGSPMAGTYHPGTANDMSSSHSSPKNMVSCSWGKGQRSDSFDDSKRHSFLELLKSCTSKKLELSDISGKIVELSTDQHGSRFIQQKLEHCGIDEKESVFKEVLPHASKLMIDVFGNYVIQKFFEHGSVEHRRKLGQQLTGQIVTLSLQMYGCRVIQKALEVIELDQKVELVRELDGHVMRCVHDQNGNHVIQKCIESAPAEKIEFIISSFQGQVASLSSHPYGCRVIQRVLEHCSDEKISRCIVDEILESACTLAQDPYGNYVTQHILEMGKPQERSQIIHKLSGTFVQMSQHKYASNVVEKCLKYGDASERNLIIEELVAQPEENGSLLMMMKDQFANYVVQKIFDIGSDKQRDILLNCVRIHLPALKRFPYAKHIVARYEQLSESSEQEQK